MLVTPSLKYEESFYRYVKELADEDPYPYPLTFDYSDFAHYVTLLQHYSEGKALPDSLVPNTTFWLIENNEMVACSHLRHVLNDSLRFAGGHIGVGVRPSMRGKGYGRKILDLTLVKAYKMDISEVHVHCYESNLASRAMIESVGGQFDSSTYIESKNEKILRFIHSQ